MTSKYKMGIPEPPESVWIPSEIENLFDGFSEKFVIVCAGQGAGKTAVVSKLALRSPKKVFWYSLDASDNGAGAFREYAEEISGQIPLYEEPYLVLDNVQELISSGVWQIILLGLLREESKLRVIFITCGGIPEALMPFLMSGRGRLLDKGAFRLISRESVAWMAAEYGVGEQIAATVAKDTCGWALGIVSTLHDLHAGNRNTELIDWKDLLNCSILSQYLDELFHKNYVQEEQELLVQTAVLGRFSWELCRKVLPENIKERTFQRLLQKGMFLYQFPEGQEYEYCSMFREYLLGQASCADIKSICRKAATYFLEQENYYRMVQYAVLGDQKDMLGGRLERQITSRNAKSKKNKNRQLLVQSFGSFQVTVCKDDRKLPWRTRKGCELFAYLVDLNGEAVGRSKLLEVLWAEDAPANAVSMLHNMIYNIRKELSCSGLEGILSYEHKKYRIDTDSIEWDGKRIGQLAGLVEQRNLPALRQVSQEFLTYWGCYLEDMDNHWIRARQGYYDEVYKKGCMFLAKQFEAEKDYAVAAEYYRNILKLDPYSEGVAAKMLSVYGEQREWKKAKQFYEEFCSVLQKDLGLEPGGELIRVYHSYLN